MNTLPIDSLLPALRDALSARHEAVLEAPPGAGKTTRVPLALLDAPWLAGQTILMLEPRRLAARAAAERLASELGERVGETVGYRIRLDSKVGPNTRIEVVTEGILARRLQDDPALDGVGLVIFDQGAQPRCRPGPGADAQWSRDVPRGGQWRGAAQGAADVRHPRRRAPGRAAWRCAGAAQRRAHVPGRYPLERAAGAGEWIEPRVVQTVQQALADEPGSLLVFLPGQAEIRRVAEQLGDVWAVATTSCSVRCMASLICPPSAPPSSQRPRASARWCWPPTSPRPA